MCFLILKKSGTSIGLSGTVLAPKKVSLDRPELNAQTIETKCFVIKFSEENKIQRLSAAMLIIHLTGDDKKKHTQNIKPKLL